MNKVYEFFGGRKLLFALILTLIATVFVFASHGDFDQWSNFMKWIFGSYAVGNGIEHTAKAIKKD
jgi:hypothetical protein